MPHWEKAGQAVASLVITRFLRLLRKSADIPAVAAMRSPGEIIMKDPVYKIIELTGTSTKSIEDAVANAIKRAHQTVKRLSWFQVVETRGNIDRGKVRHWQVTLKVGFALVN